MYRHSYAEIAADDQRQARLNEIMAIDLVLRKLENARRSPGDRLLLTEALDKTEQLWSILLADVVHADNLLPLDIRRNVVAIGRWVFERSADLRRTGLGALDALIDVNQAIRNGLDASS